MTAVRTVPFTKGHGTENDFVIVDDPHGELPLSEAEVRQLCERRAGVGADGVLRVVRTAAMNLNEFDSPHADAYRHGAEEMPEWFMDFRNADGSVGEMCGNGVRVFAAFLQHAGHVNQDRFTIGTRAGLREVDVLESAGELPGPWHVRVNLARPQITGIERTVQVGPQALPGVDVDMGNPHTVVYLPKHVDLAELDLHVRPRLDPEPPAGTNIEFVSERGPNHVAIRIHERGVGETRSCGTGAGAVTAIAAARAGLTPSSLGADTSPLQIDVPGGRLQMGWTDHGEIKLTGPAMLVASGTAVLSAPR